MAGTSAQWNRAAAFNGTKGGFKKFVKGFKKDPELEAYIIDVKKGK